MKIVSTTVAAILICLVANAQTDSINVINEDKNIFDPFPQLVYDRVVAYNISFDTVTNKKQYKGYTSISTFNYQQATKSSRQTLGPESVSNLIRVVSSNSTYGDNYGDCFDPRLGITFLNKGEEVFTLLICFECNFLESTIALPAARRNFSDATIKGGDETGTVIVRRYTKGFSKKGRKKLLKFCDSLHMRYCG